MTNVILRLCMVAVLVGLGARPVLAQEKISLKDAKEMTYQAQSTVEGLQNLLNYVAFNDNVPSELAEVISNSYKTSRNQLFFDKQVIVEDDLGATSALGKTKDLTADKYLDALDLRYEKTADASIAFTNLVISKIKKKDYLYVTVRFDEAFGSKEKASGKPYSLRQREALVRLIAQGSNKWQALIMGLGFYDPARPNQTSDNEMSITTDASAESNLVSTEDFAREKDDFVLAKQQEDKRKQLAFDEYVSLGSNYSANKQFKEALELFYKAKELRPLVPTLDKRILDTKRLMAENTFESLKNKADQAKAERRQADALRYYREALANKPEARTAIEVEIALLTKRLNEIALPKNKLESGDFQGAIDACDNILKENKKTKNDFAEIYFIKAQAYQLAAEKQAADTRSKDRALENYTLAIQAYPTYAIALLARANFYAKHKNDYVSAITDYDVVTTNTLDDSPDKPNYFVTKGKWKDLVKNYSGALEDYARAIALSPGNAAAHFAKAELLYRLKRYSEALASFNTLLRLEPTNSKYVYYRGLNYVGLPDVIRAGDDFTAAEKLGLETYQLKVVETISTSYFDDGQKAFKARKLAKADSLFDDAIAVRGCNAFAWQQKAEIRFVLAAELAKKHQLSTDKYKEGIELCKQAIDCSPKYSDAHYKLGLAYHRTGEYALALKSYTDAIRTDGNSVQAFMGRGATLMTTQHYSDAISDFSRATTLLQTSLLAAKKNSQRELTASLTTELSQAYQMMGEAWYNKNDYAKALLTTAKALEMDEKNAEALYYQGLSYEAMRDLPKALKCYADAIRFAPLSLYYYAEGRASLQAGKYEQAITSLSSVVKLDTAHAFKNAYYLRGLGYFKSHLLEPAYKDFTQYSQYAVKADSSFYADSGLLNLYLNHDADAVADFRRALTAKPNYPVALYRLGCAYAKAGQFEPAMQQFTQAYQTHRLRKEDVRLEEDAFLTELTKVKTHKTQYAQLKKTYLLVPQ